MTTPLPTPDAPRLTELPGDAPLVRISATTWEGVREAVLAGAGIDGLDAAQRAELERTGIADGHGWTREWLTALATTLATPVSVHLVCVDGARAWTSTLRVAGELVLLIDQQHAITSDARTMRLGAADPTVLLGLTDIGRFSMTVQALLPQRPAFVPPAAPAASDAAQPEAEPSPDAPAVAEVQAVVTSAEAPGAPSSREHSWYALGADGAVLTMLTGTSEEPRLVACEPGSVAPVLAMDLVGALRQAATAAQHSGNVDDQSHAGQEQTR